MLYLNVHIHIYVYKMLYRKCNDVSSVLPVAVTGKASFCVLKLDHTPKSLFFFF